MTYYNLLFLYNTAKRSSTENPKRNHKWNLKNKWDLKILKGR